MRLEGDPGGRLVPSVAGILLLGKDPQRFFPQARVAVVQYAGPTMGESFLKREIEGPIPLQLDEAVAWLVRNTLHAVELRGMERIDRHEYPRPALREAVLNALAHRDYSQRGDRVRIYAFADRVEVHSPGGLGGPMRLDNLLVRRWSRNATLVQGLAALDIIEELGFGLDRMVATMAEAGLPAPVFTEIGDTFVVTLYGAAARLRASLTPTPTPAERAGRQGPQGIPVATPTGARLRRPERQDWALERLRMHGPISPREYATALGVSVDTALNDLRDLVERGLVHAEGTTKDRRYALRTE